ncbi:N-formylglutamate amidohydrolase [Pseudooceanicola sediminis]|uniref:N-formylglutamate amidohydrolase n=1 Tax=Pseudooceanicola sediminis TaxID=2211117 RepID=A0A399J4Y7_9RHOB|nr:N-formylglutamate amidohydrolase [Pseudooceanicola sediminis]KAA2315166.1 N-formylglutamate amidohydrolase [Puniceibacterium sp. HSS470]RII39022.1 N-formylglutamate amidohydrolase [Pseudooceanicola sediminis]|tara:strand:+ start:3461 stop:4258 length:798 start_codon:yes stop_codon:yes gene_type:complete
MTASDSHILAPGEQPAVAVANPGGTGPVVLVCEHASAAIPASLGGLGLSQADRLSHAVWDPGALDLATAMSERLHAPLVAGRVSRLVYDCNRPPDVPSAMPVRSETIDVPGNAALTPAQRAARTDAIYRPFQAALSAVLERHGGAVVTVHSFTPLWHGTRRDTEIGLLHDSDARLATAMMTNWSGPLKAELNAPYSATDGVTHTLAEHAIPRGRLNVMIEVRNDLLTDAAAVAEVAEQLCGALSRSLAQLATRCTGKQLTTGGAA